MSYRKVIDTFIGKTAKNSLERKAIMQLAEVEEFGMPTPSENLPNLKKDRLVLELINRTNSNATINLFGLPSGTNSAQDLEYGDLFETVYSQVTLPTTETTTLQTYTINWVESDGTSQSATTSAVDTIDDIISELLLVTGDNFYYYIDGANTIIHKIPINTWLYWNPPSTIVVGNLLASTLSQVGGVAPENVFKAQISVQLNGVTYLYSLGGGVLTFWNVGSSVQLGQIDYDALYSFGSGQPPVGTRGYLLNLGAIGVNYSFLAINYTTQVVIRSTLNVLNGTPTALVSVTMSTTSAGYTYDEANNILWSTGGIGSGVDNDIEVRSVNGFLLDTWASPPTLDLGVGAIGYGRIVINESGIAEGYWVFVGNEGSNPLKKAIYKLGGWNTGTLTIVQSTSTEISFSDAILSQLGILPTADDQVYSYVRISDTNTFFVVLSDLSITDRNFIGTVNLDTQEQNWKYYDNDELTVLGDVYYATESDCIISKVSYLSAVRDARAINYRTLELASDTLINVAFNTGSIYFDDFNSNIYHTDDSPLGLGIASVSGGTTAIAPANSQPASFYSENNFGNFIANGSPTTYPFTNNVVIGGTGISVTELIGNLTYGEIVQEIRSGVEPYYFGEMSVYADSDEQANAPIKKVSRGVSGNSKTLFNNPTIVNQNKHIVLNTPINFLPQTINYLDYTVRPLNKVRIIINYTKGNLNAIVETLDEYIKEGIPFSVGLNELADSIPIKKEEEKYLEKTLKDIWNRKKIELRLEGINIEIDSLFNTQSTIDVNKYKLLGEKTKIIKGLIEEQKAKNSSLKGLSKNNIKRIVSNYRAKGKASDIQDPYNYLNDEL